MKPAIQVLHGPPVGPPHLDTAGEPAGRFGDEDLARLRDRADARGEVHVEADVVAALLDRLAGVDADADLDPLSRLASLRLGDGPLDRDRAQDSRPSPPEGGHEAVAELLDDRTADLFDLLSDNGVVSTEHLPGGLVTFALRVVREPTDITEEDGDGVTQRRRQVGGGLRDGSFVVRVLVHSRRCVRWHRK